MEWINVQDQLPEGMKLVLCHSREGHCFIGYLPADVDDHSKILSQKFIERIYCQGRGGLIENKDQQAMFWMPLPPSPPGYSKEDYEVYHRKM